MEREELLGEIQFSLVVGTLHLGFVLWYAWYSRGANRLNTSHNKVLKFAPGLRPSAGRPNRGFAAGRRLAPRYASRKLKVL